ncbi:MAG: PAS domain S-box protein [Archaeoglobus sp.]|uniref:PAS domain S-box protein n=1 Tax=Archaeoglobus sp. TaxID=1872626 RepID=UPI001DB79EC9|nr:PAS domain S-box protein [Archaeoglobus sp.]MBO8178944.1 PAS domain S-box protein [Archaeoglobus sp.]
MSQFILLKLNERGKIIEVSGIPGLKGKYFYEVFKFESEGRRQLARYNGLTFKVTKVNTEDGQICVLIPERGENALDYLPVGVAIVQDGEIAYSNSTFSKFIDGDHYVEKFLNIVSSLPDSLKDVVRRELEITTEFGEEKKLELIVSAGYYMGKDALICVLVDVTRDREFENLFLTLTKKAFVVVYIIQDGKFVFLNEMASNLGYSLEELYHMNPFDLVHPEDREQIVDNYVRRLAGEFVEVPYRFRLVARDGRILYVDAIAARVNFKGRPAVMGMLIDRTEEMQNQEKLRMYEMFFRESKDMFFILDRKGRFIDVNPRYAEILGYGKEDLLGKTSRFIAHEEDLAVLRENFARVLRGESVKFTFRAKSRDGSIRFVEVVEWPVFRNGEVTGAEGVTRDITERVRTEEELKKKNQLLRIISEVNELILKERDEYALLQKVCRFFSKIKDIDSWAWIIDGNSIIKATPLAPECSLAERSQDGVVRFEDCECPLNKAKSLAVPIKHNGNVFGVLVLCNLGSLTDEEIKILEELGTNLGFAISSYRAERDRKIAFNLLLENLNQLESLADRLRNPVAIISGYLEIREDIGYERTFKEIENQVERINKILDDLRLQETLTYFILRGEKYK